jgi:hypothetical protein
MGVTPYNSDCILQGRRVASNMRSVVERFMICVLRAGSRSPDELEWRHRPQERSAFRSHCHVRCPLRRPAEVFQSGHTYTQGRPDCPPKLKDRLLDTLPSGTSKFTRLLDAIGAEVIAVDPVWEMGEQLLAPLPHIKLLSGTAQAILIDSGTAPALVYWHAFRWFATKPALAEIHWVLEPGGWLGLGWNARDWSEDRVAA